MMQVFVHWRALGVQVQTKEGGGVSGARKSGRGLCASAGVADTAGWASPGSVGALAAGALAGAGSTLHAAPAQQSSARTTIQHERLFIFIRRPPDLGRGLPELANHP